MLNISNKIIVLSLIAVGAVFLCPLTSHAEIKRYRPVPLGDGLVFILDTWEGHAWTWQNSIPGSVSASGETPRITYQGNVRKNMKPPEKATGSFPQPDTTSPQRF